MNEETVKQKAIQYADGFRLRTQELGWHEEKMIDFIAGYSLASEELKRKDEEIARLKKERLAFATESETWKKGFNQVSKSIAPIKSLLQSREDECKRLMNVISVVNDYPLEHHPQGIKDEINLLLAQSEKL